MMAEMETRKGNICIYLGEKAKVPFAHSAHKSQGEDVLILAPNIFQR